MPRSRCEMTGSRRTRARLLGILLVLSTLSHHFLLGQENPNNPQPPRSARQQRLERQRLERERQQSPPQPAPAAPAAPASQAQVLDPPPSTLVDSAPAYSEPERISQPAQADVPPNAPPNGPPDAPSNAPPDVPTGFPQEPGGPSAAELPPPPGPPLGDTGALPPALSQPPAAAPAASAGSFASGAQLRTGQTDTRAENTTQARHVRVLSNRIYMYSYFNVVFETPFEGQDSVAITPVRGFPPSLLRNNTLIFGTYRDQNGRNKRSFTLGFYSNSAGIHRLPPVSFRRTTDNQVWQSESVDFAVFAPDETRLALPVRLSLSELPPVAYVGQDIVFSALAEYAGDLNQSRLNGPLELAGAQLRSSPILPGIQQQRVLGYTVYQIPLQSWVVTPLEPGTLQIPALQAQVMGLQRSSAAQQIQVLSLPPPPSDFGAFAVQAAAQAAAQVVPVPIPIGEFQVAFHISDKQSRFAGNDLSTPALYALDETLRISYRISGAGNLAALQFPEVHADPGLLFLQAQDSLEYKAQSNPGGAPGGNPGSAPGSGPSAPGSLEGTRTRTLYYRASEPGIHQIRSEAFRWFSPAGGVWKQALPQDLSVEFSKQFSQEAFYPNLDQLWFSRPQMYWLSFCYLVQEHAFYFALIPVLLLLVLGFLPFLAESMGHLRRRYRKYNLSSPSNPSSFKSDSSLKRPTKLPFGASVWVPWLLVGSCAIVVLALGFYAVHRLDIQQAQTAMQEGDIAAAQQLYTQLLSAPTQQTTASPDSLQLGLRQRPWMGAYTAGLLPNEVLLRYRQGQPLEALQLAYLNYYLQPTHSLSVRLLNSLRNKIGLTANLPAGFLWWRIARHYWGLLGLLLVYGVLGHFLHRRRRLLQMQETQHYVPTPQQLNTRNFHILQLLRSHGLLALLVLLSLTWRSERPTALNMHPQQKLAPIPVAISLREDAEIATRPQSILQQGEIVLIQGTTMQADTSGELHSFSLVNSESQKQGWIPSKYLFFVPLGPSR